MRATLTAGSGRRRLGPGSASSPTETRTVPSVMPTAARASGASRRWVVVAGCVSDFASPRLFEMSTSLSAFMSANASSLPPVDLEGHHGPPAVHLPQGQLVLRVATRGTGARPGGARACCHSSRVRATVRHESPPCSTRSDSVSRPLTRTQALNGDIDGPVCRMRFLTGPVDELARSEHRATEDAALAVDVLRGRVDDDVGAVLERVGEDRRPEDVVDDDLRPGGVGEVGDRRDVDELLHRVARRLEEDRRRRLRTAPHATGRGPAPSTKTVSTPHRGRISSRMTKHDPKSARDDTTRSPVAEQRRQRDEHRRHAGCRREARLGALEQAQPLLEHRHRGVAVAGVDEVVDLVLEGRLGLLGRLVDEARRSGRAPRPSRRNRCAPALPARRWCRGCQSARRAAQPCRHGSPAIFQPDTVRWPSAVVRALEALEDVVRRTETGRVAASAAATERTPDRQRK